MHILLTVLAATPSPEPTDPANTFYSPGTLGFIMTFLVSAGAIGLIFDMVRRVRRVRYRAEIAERLDAEAAASGDAAGAPKSAAARPVAKKPAAPAKPARPAAPPKPQRD